MELVKVFEIQNEVYNLFEMQKCTKELLLRNEGTGQMTIRVPSAIENESDKADIQRVIGEIIERCTGYDCEFTSDGKINLFNF